MVLLIHSRKLITMQWNWQKNLNVNMEIHMREVIAHRQKVWQNRTKVQDTRMITTTLLMILKRWADHFNWIERWIINKKNKNSNNLFLVRWIDTRWNGYGSWWILYKFWTFTISEQSTKSNNSSVCFIERIFTCKMTIFRFFRSLFVWF